MRVNLLYESHCKFTPPLEISKFLAKKLIVRGKISVYYINMRDGTTINRCDNLGWGCQRDVKRWKRCRGQQQIISCHIAFNSRLS